MLLNLGTQSHVKRTKSPLPLPKDQKTPAVVTFEVAEAVAVEGAGQDGVVLRPVAVAVPEVAQ